MKLYIISLFVLLMSLTSIAQDNSSDKIKPQWMHKHPNPTNSTFRYEIVSSCATSLEIARNKCLTELIASTGISQGIIATSNYSSSEKLSQIWNNGKLTENLEHESQTTVTVNGEDTKIYIKNIDEFWTRDDSGMYYLTKLYAKSELGTPPIFDNIEITTKYGIHGLWRSAIVPGWGQLYKGCKTKGLLIMMSEIVTIGGIIYTENERANYKSKMISQPNFTKIYKTRIDNLETIRNCCIGVAASIYIYNLIDALVTPGARRVIINQRRFNITPMTSQVYTGLSLSYNF